MEETEEKLTSEEIKLLDKIREIKNSNEVNNLIEDMITYAENNGIPEFSFRIKEEQSALNKFRNKGYTDADRMGDLIGMMFTTESTTQIYKVVEYLRETVPHDKEKDEDDFVKNPKAGYRSYHVNSKNLNFDDLQDIEAPLEVQIKTKPMQIAQNSVHDTVYKKGTLPKEIRNQLSEILFPVVEGMAQIAGFIDKDDIRESSEIKQEINSLLKQNLSILRQYADVLNDVNKQYKLIADTKDNTQKQTILNELDLIQETIMQKNNSDMISKMHDQKSPQFFENIETGKYNVPPPYSPKDLEQDDNPNINQQNNTALVEYKPNRLKMFFDNIVNRIKSFNLYKIVMNTGKNKNTDNESIDRATEKMEEMKKQFDSYVVVSEEEQEKNRKEYEQSKQKSASLSVTKGKEQEGEERY